MKLIAVSLAALLWLAGQVTTVIPPTPQNEWKADSIYTIKIPAGYRDWKLISVAHEAGKLNDLRAILGNDIAVNAYREGKLPLPDGAIIARLAWAYTPSEENNKAFGNSQSFVAGQPTNVQFSIKDSKKYALSGGWAYAQFNEGQSVNVAVNATCFACHQAVKERDFVFTKYSH
jgi:hypothetical protein